MASCACAPPVLLLHVTLLLAVVTGAALATAARLKWDPSTYIVVRTLFPTEYRVTAVILCATSCALLALAHLAGTALSMRRVRVRRAILYTYAVLMATLVFVEVTWAVWMCVRVVQWLKTPLAREVIDLVQFGRDMEPHLRKILIFFSYWHPLPGQVNALIQEAENDVPRNLYVGVAAVALVAALQPAAVVLALLCARALRTSAPYNAPAKHLPVSVCSSSSFVSEKVKTPAPGRLKIFIRDGKFVRL